MKYLGTNYHVWQLNGIDSGERNEGKHIKFSLTPEVELASSKESGK